VDCRTERGERGDHNGVLTGVGGRRQRPDFGGGRSSGAPRAAAVGAGTSRGDAPGRLSTMSERLLAGNSMLGTWGVEARALRTRRVYV
jgi:hypothetical protein